MAISRESFEKSNFPHRRNDRRDHPVFKLLQAHPDQAFTVTEIAERVRMNEDTVRSIFRGLVKDGVVVHKTPYWAIARRKRK